ncbi:hypothetical protein JCM16814_11230 [Desulfobaculum senezii]
MRSDSISGMFWVFMTLVLAAQAVVVGGVLYSTTANAEHTLWAMLGSSCIMAVVMLVVGRVVIVAPFAELEGLGRELEEKNLALSREASEREQIMNLLEFKSTQLRKQELLLQGIIEDQTDFICRFRADGMLTFANAAYCALAGKPCDELVESARFVLFDDAQSGWLDSVLASLGSGHDVTSNSASMRDADGNERWVQWVIRAVNLEGNEKAEEFQAVGHDMTETRALHTALQQSNKELEHRVEERTAELQAINATMEVEIQERARAEAEARDKERFLSRLLDGMRAAYVVVDRASNVIITCNDVAETLLEVTAAEVTGMPCGEAFAHLAGESWRYVCNPLVDGATFEDAVLEHADGRIVPVDKFAFHLGDERLAVVLVDVSERKDLERQLSVAQKMESIGLLASGIAHEINTPIQYAGDSVRFLREAIADMLEVFGACTALTQRAKDAGIAAQEVERLEELAEEADMDFVAEEAPRACDRVLDGVGRVASIVLAMKNFAHPGNEEKKAVDLNKALANTITISKNEWKYVAELSFDPDAELPMVTCLAGDINQVLLNIIVNSAHAIREVVGDSGDKGRITITTSHDEHSVRVRVADTGSGIKKENVNKIFDPFFTTKEVGKGTGQGLAITHDIIVNKHGGKIDVQSEVGKGTTMTITLPRQAT